MATTQTIRTYLQLALEQVDALEHGESVVSRAVLEQLDTLQARVSRLQESSRVNVREIQEDVRETILVALGGRWHELEKQHELQVKAGWEGITTPHYMDAIRQAQRIVKEVEL